MSTIKGLLSDYGGTLDTGGDHWGKVLWHGYERARVPVSEEQFRQAYVHAERTLATQPLVTPQTTFRSLLGMKIGIELRYITEQGVWHASDDEVEERRSAILEDLYGRVCERTSHSGRVLSALSESYPIVLVTNFYGNISTVLHEFGLDGFFTGIVESAVAGVRKPDPKIFTLGVERLGISPDKVMAIGDSYSKDIVPATAAGCHTAWLRGEEWLPEKNVPGVASTVISDLSELKGILSSEQRFKDNTKSKA